MTHARSTAAARRADGDARPAPHGLRTEPAAGEPAALAPLCAPEELPCAAPARPGQAPPLSLVGGDELDWDALLPRSPYARRGKRLLNLALLLVCAPFALLLGLPIALANAVLFRDPRRVLFRQPRVGLRGRVFWIYKFRTMREAPAGAFDSWKRGDGLRVTRLGRLLRNTHLDELPQLFNVLRGEMDFVGPRPEMVEIDAWACEHVPDFRERNALLPGITGLAQITHGYAGMDAAAYGRKLAADQRYRERLSLGLDLSILARTAVWMLRGRGWRRAAPGAVPEAGAAR